MSTTLEQPPIQEPEPKPSRNRRGLVVILAVLVVIATATAVAIAVFTGNDEPQPSPGSPPSAGPTTATAPSAVEPSTPTPSQLAEPNEPADPVLADGRYPAYLTAIDTRAGTLTFDVIQYLTGAEAAKAFHRAHPEIKEDPPNGYYIVNRNPRLRTLPVRGDIPVEVLWLGDGLGSDTITFEQLPDYFAKEPVNDKYLWYDPFWLTVRGDRIVAIAEQYIP